MADNNVIIIKKEILQQAIRDSLDKCVLYYVKYYSKKMKKPDIIPPIKRPPR